MNDKKSVYNWLYRAFIGLVLGFANVIPGVSGGTMMVVFGVYERIIGLINEFFKRIKTEWRYFLPIGVGMVAAIIIFGTLMDSLISSHEAVMAMFFVGVILFSIPGIFKKAALSKKRVLKTEIACVLAFVLMFGVMVLMDSSDANKEKEEIKAQSEQTELVEGEEAAEDEYTPDHSAGHLLMLVVYGAVACATMIIPGISGSLVMVMLGQYAAIMAAIHHMDILFLLPFAIGCLLGLIVCAKAIKWLLKHYERVTYSAILGFVAGSLLPVFPDWTTAFSAGGIIAFVLGGACIVACELLAPKEA